MIDKPPLWSHLHIYQYIINYMKYHRNRINTSIPCSMSLVYTLCLNRAIQEHFHIYIFIFRIRREFKEVWVGGQAFTLHELKYSWGLELRKGHYIIYINLTSLFAREIDETSKWGVSVTSGTFLVTVNYVDILIRFHWPFACHRRFS